MFCTTINILSQQQKWCLLNQMGVMFWKIDLSDAYLQIEIEGKRKILYD